MTPQASARLRTFASFVAENDGAATNGGLAASPVADEEGLL